MTSHSLPKDKFISTNINNNNNHINNKENLNKPNATTNTNVATPANANNNNKRREAFKRKKTDASMLDHQRRLTRISSFKVIDLNQNMANKNEFAPFVKTINDLKHKCGIEKQELENLIVFSPVLDSPIINRLYESNIRVNVRHGQTLRTSLTVSLQATVETLVYEVLTTFNVKDEKESGEIEMSTDKYLLKIHGLEEYLPVRATLGELKHVHECLIENREPQFVLDELYNVNTQLSVAKKHLEEEEEAKSEVSILGNNCSSLL